MKKSWISLSLVLLLPTQDGLRANTISTSNSVSANIQAAGSLTVTSSVPLTNGTTFNPYTGTDNLLYKARTTSTGTGGIITLQSTSDFAAGGPAVSPHELTYNCGTAGLGTECSGSTTVSTSATTVVNIPKSACTGGGSPCSSGNPNSVAVTFSLLDDPRDQTGTYTATITFTISTT